MLQTAEDIQYIDNIVDNNVQMIIKSSCQCAYCKWYCKDLLFLVHFDFCIYNIHNYYVTDLLRVYNHRTDTSILKIVYSLYSPYCACFYSGLAP